MALISDYILPEGTNLNDFYPELRFDYMTKNEPYLANSVYVKIESVTSNSTEAELTVVFKKSRDSKILTSKKYIFGLTSDSTSKNILEQGYGYLLTLDEFKGASSAWV